MKRPPCIRGLTQFKKGCPQRQWDGSAGCPAWIELSIASKGNPLQREVKKQCVDLWAFEFQWAALGTLEGVQQATESSRNMVALAAMVASGAKTPEQLAHVASKHIIHDAQLLPTDTE